LEPQSFDQTVEKFRAAGFAEGLARQLAELVFRFPEFAPIADAWPSLSPELRREIVSLCQSSPRLDTN
jgi:hypothetical protein